MAETIDYYFTPISPWAYLGSQRFEDIVRRHGVRVRVKPVDYGTIFPATGGLPLAKRAPARQAYRLQELARWRTYLGVPLTLQPRHFPVPDALASGTILAAAALGHDALGLAHALLRALWAEERDISDEATVAEIAAGLGLGGSALVAHARSPEVAATFAAATQEALARGVFGAPTYAVGEALFWGQDRLNFLDRVLAARP
jgi:2-hydroxychromene-2-carboxylate isomerase